MSRKMTRIKIIDTFSGAVPFVGLEQLTLMFSYLSVELKHPVLATCTLKLITQFLAMFCIRNAFLFLMDRGLELQFPRYFL